MNPIIERAGTPAVACSALLGVSLGTIIKLLLFVYGAQDEKQHGKNPQWPEKETCNHKPYPKEWSASNVPLVKWLLSLGNILATMLADCRTVLEVGLRTKWTRLHISISPAKSCSFCCIKTCQPHLPEQRTTLSLPSLTQASSAGKWHLGQNPIHLPAVLSPRLNSIPL